MRASTCAQGRGEPDEPGGTPLSPPPDELPRLDPLLHQPVRTQLVAILSGRGTASFGELKQALGITDGNLGAHLAKLQDAGLLESGLVPGGTRPQTVFALTVAGHAALAEYVEQLAALVRLSEAPAPAPAPAASTKPSS